ncbi:MAG: GTPase HflX [Eubacterium sp.]
MIDINAEGVRKSIIEELDGMMHYQMEDQVLLDHFVLEILVRLTNQLHREILMMTSDKNTIEYVGIGDVSKVSLGNLEIGERTKGLNRLRVIHTHPNGSPYLSEEDLSAADNRKIQCMVAVGVYEDKPPRFGIGAPMVNETSVVYGQGVFETLEKLNAFPLDDYVYMANRALKKDPDALFDLEDETERALLVGVEVGNKRDGIDLDESMEELARLVETADGIVVDRVTQNRTQFDPIFYVGRGKLMEIVRMIQNLDINLIAANDELNSNQIRMIETMTGVKTIDRTTLILDIFAKHAKTKEGKLQVELAQQKYRLGHLKGLGIVLSRTGGGIGTRGPGEKKLETDRRHIRRQIDELERKNEKINQTNERNALSRQKNNIRTAALIGYTNSGKSTLFNVLTESDAVVKNGLFITLDSTIRKVRPEDGDYLISDTVGFIEKLPHDLVKAFKTTLKEVETADLLLHVIDASNPNCQAQIEVVNQVLREIGSGHQNVLMVYNKMDKLSSEEQQQIQNRALREEHAVCISAAKIWNIENLTEEIRNELKGMSTEITYCIPYDASKALALLHEKSTVLETNYDEKGTVVKVLITQEFPVHLYEKYVIA